MAILLVALLFGVPFRASADVYQLVDLGSSFGNDVVGLTSTGDVVVHYFIASPGVLEDKWGLFTRDGAVTFFDTKPALSYDNGGNPCNNSVLPIRIDDGALRNCNNGRVAFTYAGVFQLWEAPDPVGGPAPSDEVTLVYNSGGVNPLLMNAEGDLAFGTFDRNYVAYDLGPTPEPSSLLLLATGALGSGVVLRRRFANERRI